MKLIADSGSTKTDWVLSKKGKRVHQIETQGINPFYQNSEEITNILNNELLPQSSGNIPTEIFFYGAGCSFPDKQELLHTAFTSVLGRGIAIHLQSDLVGAAVALFGNNEGVACILGTGSNSCHWDGKKIVKNAPPLGYILGDEGSGAVLGKLFIADLLKQQLPQALSTKFFEQYNTNYEEIMAKVYKQSFPNRSLAQYCYFLHENINEPCIYKIVKNSFDSFFKRNILQYPKGLRVSFVGSIAVVFEKILSEVLRENNLKLGSILKKPIDELERHHTNI